MNPKPLTSTERTSTERTGTEPAGTEPASTERPANGEQAQPASHPPQDQRAVESTLVAQAKENAHAFGALYERYIDRIYSYVYTRVQNVQDAEDLTARIFYRALDRLDRYEDRGLPFGAWLFRIAHNLVANWHRDQSRRRSIPIDGLALPGRPQNEPAAMTERREEEDALWEAIERLPADRKQLLLHKFGDRLTNLEIGALMQKSEGAIKSLYFRTLAALRTDLKEHFYRDESGRNSEAGEKDEREER